MNNDTDEFLSPTCIFVWTLNENQNLGHNGNAEIEKKIGQGHKRGYSQKPYYKLLLLINFFIIC